MNQCSTSTNFPNNHSKKEIHFPSAGPITIPMTNDYLFRALLQRNNNVLKGLISALLHLDPADISSVLITNPIELGKTCDEKDFILDIKLIMNNYVIINLEMQVINEHNWPDRSLNYLCRCFDDLDKGQPYTSAHPVIQIGLLAYSAKSAHPFQRNGAPFRFKLSRAQLVISCSHPGGGHAQETQAGRPWMSSC